MEMGAINARMCECPSADHDLGFSYYYNPNVNLDSETVADVVVMFEALENHDSEGGNVLFDDGSVEFYTMPEYEEWVGPYMDEAVEVD